MQNVQAQGWHVAQWGTWGWAETIVKLIGIAAGIAAFFASAGAASFFISGNPHLAAVIWLALLTLIFLVTIGLRFQQRETISLIFAVLNFLGHLALLIA